MFSEKKTRFHNLVFCQETENDDEEPEKMLKEEALKQDGVIEEIFQTAL